MRKMVVASILALAIAAVAVMLSGCSRSPSRSSSTVAETVQPTSALPTNSSEAPDDIVPVQFGIEYRADIQQQGVTPRWPTVETTSAKLVSGQDTLFVDYRNEIITGRGQVRNNILRLTLQNALSNSSVSNDVGLYAVGAPSGLELDQNGLWPHLNSVATVLVIEVPESMKAGKYDFAIGVKVDGEDFGTLPCEIQVSG